MPGRRWKGSDMPANNTVNNTMYEYLSWRGDLTFEQDPFNEVDNLILAQMAYVDYDDIVSDDREKKVAISDVARLYWELHTVAEIRSRGSFVRMSPFLLEPVAKSRRFRKMMLTGYVNYVSTSSEAQMSAVQFELEDGTTYVAFRGTDETLVGWKEDFNLSFMPQTEGQRLAVEYMKIHFRDTNLRLRVGGHSKGGNFAIYASAFSGREVARQISEIYACDAPGFREEVTETDEYRKVLPRTTSIIPEDSVIGVLFGTGLEPVVIKSSATGIMQHDALTWQVMGNRFVRTERSDDSLFVQKVVTDWLSKVDDDSRKIFVDQIFGVLQSTGAYTMKDIRTANFKEVLEAIQIARRLPKDEQKEITQVLTQLFRSGEKTFYEAVENAGGSMPEFVRRWAAKRGDQIERKQIALEQAMAEEEAAIEQASERPAKGQPEQEKLAQGKLAPEQTSSESPAHRSKLQEEITRLQAEGLPAASENISE